MTISASGNARSNAKSWPSCCDVTISVWPRSVRNCARRSVQTGRQEVLPAGNRPSPATASSARPNTARYSVSRLRMVAGRWPRAHHKAGAEPWSRFASIRNPPPVVALMAPTRRAYLIRRVDRDRCITTNDIRACAHACGDTTIACIGDLRRFSEQNWRPYQRRYSCLTDGGDPRGSRSRRCQSSPEIRSMDPLSRRKMLTFGAVSVLVS